MAYRREAVFQSPWLCCQAVELVIPPAAGATPTMCRPRACCCRCSTAWACAPGPTANAMSTPAVRSGWPVKRPAACASQARCSAARGWWPTCRWAAAGAGVLARSAALPADPALPHRGVERAREYLAAEPARNDTLADIARAVPVSPFHLARQFRQRAGCTLHGFRTRQRLLAALARLRQGEQNLTPWRWTWALPATAISALPFGAVLAARHGRCARI